MTKSYYDILNISEAASKKEIKNQYKKLVKMFHPDVNSSLEAEFLFKEINKAAEVLLDDEKRKNYDSLRKTGSKKHSFNDLFKKKDIKPKKGDDIFVEVEINYQEALLGTYRIVNISQSSICPKCQGRKFANGTICPYCKGIGEKTTNKKITVKIPAGLKNKTKLRIKNEGKEGSTSILNGDLFIIVNIESNSELRIIDGTVYCEAKISPYLAVLGGSVKVSTLWGEAMIKIPPLTKANQSFKLVNVGVLDTKTNKKGDEIVKIIIETPSSITDEEYRLYEKLRDINLKKKNGKYI